MIVLNQLASILLSISNRNSPQKKCLNWEFLGENTWPIVQKNFLKAGFTKMIPGADSSGTAGIIWEEKPDRGWTSDQTLESHQKVHCPD